MKTDTGVKAAFKKVTGKDSDGHCLRKSADFPGLAIVAESMVPDAGCIGEVWIWQCHEMGPKDEPEILQSAGWKTTDDAGRAKLARTWEQIDGGDLLESADDKTTADFAKAGKTFTPLSISAHGGAVEITGWMRHYGANVGGEFREYTQISSSFDRDGMVRHPDDDAPASFTAE